MTGCDLGDPPAADPPSASAAPAADPDAALVEAVIAELDELVALVTAAAAARPGLAPGLAAYAALHQAHRSTLPDREGEPARPRISGSAGEVADRVRRREGQARRRLADWALAAESGALARLLASMSAGIAAQLADTAMSGAAR